MIGDLSRTSRVIRVNMGSSLFLVNDVIFRELWNSKSNYRDSWFAIFNSRELCPREFAIHKRKRQLPGISPAGGEAGRRNWPMHWGKRRLHVSATPLGENVWEELVVARASLRFLHKDGLQNCRLARQFNPSNISTPYMTFVKARPCTRSQYKTNHLRLFGMFGGYRDGKLMRLNLETVYQ